MRAKSILSQDDYVIHELELAPEVGDVVILPGGRAHNVGWVGLTGADPDGCEIIVQLLTTPIRIIDPDLGEQSP